ncbi:MAG: chemotaxis protein CheW [Polyangiaceae bacterium]
MAQCGNFWPFLWPDNSTGSSSFKFKRILSPPPLTIVPRAPRHVLGVCSVRGQLVTVVELKRLMRLSESGTPRRARILLSNCAGEVVGFFVDEVRQVLRLSEGEIELSAAALGGEAPEHVIGIGRPGNDVLILLDSGANTLALNESTS